MKKAFDCKEHEAVFKALITIDIDETYITILKYIYTGATARVHVDNQVSEKIQIHVLGNPISPNLFRATIQEIFKDTQLVEK